MHAVIYLYLPLSLFSKTRAKDEHFCLPCSEAPCFSNFAAPHVGRSLMTGMYLVYHLVTPRSMSALRPLHTHHGGFLFSLYLLAFLIFASRLAALTTRRWVRQPIVCPSIHSCILVPRALWLSPGIILIPGASVLLSFGIVPLISSG